MHQSQNFALQQFLAPQLQQSLLILQAPLLELHNLVQQEMETNPVLEELPSERSPEDSNGDESSADGNFNEEFDKMLALIQSFYPPGVGARDLRDCLLIQLQREGKESSLEYKIISNYMEDLGKRRFPEIARRMNRNIEEVQKCANNIAQLNPRPGQTFAAAPQNYVLPDVTV